MLYGSHAKSVDDISYLVDLGLDFGEVILRDNKTLSYWLNSGLINRPGSNLFLIAHGPHEGPPNDSKNLWDHYFPALRETVDLCGELAIHFLTVHLWLDPRFVRPYVALEKIEVLKELVQYGLDRNVLISLENLSETAMDLKPVIAAVSGLALTLDVGHGQLLTRTNTSIGLIDELLSSIGHVHVHDNHGGVGVADDLHLPIGDGIIDFSGILESLIKRRYNGTITLELEKKDIKSSWERIRQMVNTIETGLHQF